MGQVKTRLARSVGAQKAMEIYQKLCDYTITESGYTGLSTWFYFSDYVDDTYLKGLNVDRGSTMDRSLVQSGTDLGTRMYRSFQKVLGEHDGALIIGTDCPYLDRASIKEALYILESDNVDVVIGPAFDGGYYALGMKQPHDVFTGVNWSTGLVLEQTLKRIVSLNLRYKFLPVLDDVDYESDWESFLATPSAVHFKEVIRASSSARETEGEL